MAVTIHAPSAEFGGVTGGIRFRDGVATVERLPVAVAAYMARHRYLIREDPPLEAPTPPDDTPPPTTKAAPGRRSPISSKKEAGQ